MADVAWAHEIMDLCAAGEGEKFAAFFADDGFAEDVGRGERFEGRDAIAKWIAPTPKFIADAHFEFESALSDGERVRAAMAVQWHVDR